MASNPSSRLRDTLANWYPAEPVMIEREYRFFHRTPPCMDETIEHLKYIKYQPFVGIYDYATIQECTELDNAERNWDTQRMYDSRFLIHPKRCVRHENKYFLIFQTIMREFNFWVKAHSSGDVTDEDMWKIFKDIGKNMMYLSTEDRPHGNLQQGIGITTDPKALFYNLGADTRRHIFGDDVQALHGFLDVTESKFKDLKIREYVTRWKSFLSTSCLKLTPVSTPVLHSLIYPMYCPNHVKLVFRYPASCDSYDDSYEKLQLLENMHRLCEDKDLTRHCLRNYPAFEKSLAARYHNWPSKLQGRVILTEVYDYGILKGKYKRQTGNTSIPCAASIVIFAQNCVKHYRHSVSYTRKTVLPGIESRQILDELCTVFPYLIQDIYQAFHLALASGYYHPEFSVAQILTV